MKPKVAVIGTGMMGKNHVRVFSESPDAELVGIVDTNPKTLSEISKKYSTNAYASIGELLAGEKPDGVSVCVPTSLHEEVASSFLGKGISVLVEKPIAKTIDEAEKLIALADQNSCTLMVGHIERFNPAIQRLKQLIDEKAIGDLISFSSKRLGPGAPRITDAGVIVDLATHDIDAMRYLLGKEVTEVYTKRHNVNHNHEDHAIIVLTFEGDTTSIIEASWITPYKLRTLTTTGTEGVAFLDYIEQEIKISSIESEQQPEVRHAEPLVLELQEFLSCIREKRPPLVTGKDATNNLKVALAAMESATTGLAVKL